MKSFSLPVPDAPLQRNLEYLVPLSAFGFTLLGILLWQSGIRIPIQFFAAGCVVSSCILAYLAFIRPRKDIVALSTPLYAFIFFVVPTDYESGIVLQILYGVSITILLVRLKWRFGSCAPGRSDRTEEGPLRQYVESVSTIIPPVDPATADDAASVFIHFAEGEYAIAAQYAGRRQKTLPDPSEDPVAMAFAIVAEQAFHMGAGESNLPDVQNGFAVEQQHCLFHAPVENDPEHASATALDNALLLLYAVAKNGPGEGSVRISGSDNFAYRISKTF